MADSATAELAWIVRQPGAHTLADRLERAVTHRVRLLTLTIDERAFILDQLEEPLTGSPSYAPCF